MWLALLLPLVPYLARRVLISLGIGIVTYATTAGLTNMFIAQITASMASTDAVVLQMASLFGVPDAMGILLGAYSTAGSLAAIRKFALI